VIENIRYFDHKKCKDFLSNLKSRFFNSKFYWLQILLFLRIGLNDEFNVSNDDNVYLFASIAP
jgi:hypothetical protein